MTTGAFQDGMPYNHCWGCGPATEGGLHLKSSWEDEAERVAVARFRPRPEHTAGPRHVLNGGIIATLIDCHSICTAMADGYVREGRPIGSEPIVWFVTASMRIDYLRPAPIGAEVLVRARVIETTGRKAFLETRLLADEAECARADVVAVRVPPTWFEPPGRESGDDRER